MTTWKLALLAGIALLPSPAFAQGPPTGPEQRANKDQPNGYAGLDNAGLLKLTEAPPGLLRAANNLSDLANAATARTNLGLGTIAVQNANNVTLTTSATSSLLGLNPTWTGTVAQVSGVNSPVDLEFNEGATSANGAAILSGFLVNSFFNGTQTQAVAAHAAITGDEYIQGPSSPTTPFKQYIGGFFNTATLGGDGGVQTTMASPCTPTTCTAGTVLPLTSLSSTNGNYTHTFAVNDLIGIVPVTVGLGASKYWIGTVLAVNTGAKTITITPPLIGNVASGATVWDLSQAGNMWGLATDVINAVNGDTVPGDPNENLFGVVGIELDVGMRNSKSAWNRFGVLVSGLGNIPAIANDDAIAITSGAAGGGWQNGISFTNVSGQRPVQANGTLLLAEGGWQTGSFIDFSRVSCSTDEIFMPGFVVDCTGLVYTYGSQQGVNFFPVLTLGAGALGWNQGGQGETDIYNGHPAGTGGVAFYQVNAGGAPSGAPTWSVDKTGAELVTNGITVAAGGLTVNGNAGITAAGGGAISISGAVGTPRSFAFQTNGSDRWAIVADTSSESGGNAGSNLLVCRFADNGSTEPDCPIQANRASGLVSMLDGLTLTGGNLSVASGNVTASGQLASNGGLVVVNGAVQTNRSILLETSTLPRWLFLGDSTAESGSNVGTNLSVCAYADNGSTLLGCPFAITRATLLTTISSGLTISAGALTLPSGGTFTIPGPPTGTATSYACFTTSGQLISKGSPCI